MPTTELADHHPTHDTTPTDSELAWETAAALGMPRAGSYTTGQVATMLGISTNLVRGLMRAGTLPTLRDCVPFRVPAAALGHYLRGTVADPAGDQ